MRQYGIVDTDNYGGDYPNERYVVNCWLREETAKAIADLLNEESGPNSHRFYKVMKRSYVLQPGSEP